MKYETFEKAAEIREEINRLDALVDLICNAGHQNCTLAALRPQSYETACNDNRIMNEEVLDNDTRDAFLGIIRTKINELRNEFESL